MIGTKEALLSPIQCHCTYYKFFLSVCQNNSSVFGENREFSGKKPLLTRGWQGVALTDEEKPSPGRGWLGEAETGVGRYAEPTWYRPSSAAAAAPSPRGRLGGYFSFSRSRISVSRTSSLVGSGSLGGSAASASFCLPSSLSLFRPFTRKNTTRARIRKLMTAEMKLP